MTICQHFWQYHESGIFRHLHFHVYSWLWRRLPCLLESQLVDQVLLHLWSCKLFKFPLPISIANNFFWIMNNKPHSLSFSLKLGVRLQLFFTCLSNSLAPGLWCLLLASWSADASIVFWQIDAMGTMIRILPSPRIDQQVSLVDICASRWLGYILFSSVHVSWTIY